MSLVVNTRKSGDVCVATVSGRLTLGDGVGTMRDAIRQIVKEGHQKVLIDLADVSYVDSSGLGVLVAGFASVANQGGRLKLLNVISRVQDLLLITKLYTVFEVFEDEATALKSFEQPAASAVQR